MLPRLTVAIRSFLDTVLFSHPLFVMKDNFRFPQGLRLKQLIDCLKMVNAYHVLCYNAKKIKIR
jgi:hypothetical protein